MLNWQRKGFRVHTMVPVLQGAEMVKLDPRDPPWGLIPDPGSPIPGPCKKYIYHKNTSCDIERQMGVEMIMQCGEARPGSRPSSRLTQVTEFIGFLFRVENLFLPDYTTSQVTPAQIFYLQVLWASGISIRHIISFSSLPFFFLLNCNGCRLQCLLFRSGCTAIFFNICS